MIEYKIKFSTKSLYRQYKNPQLIYKNGNDFNTEVNNIKKLHHFSKNDGDSR